VLKFVALGGALLLAPRAFEPSQAFEEVEITGYGFRPETVEVVVGQRLIWNNISKTTQTVTHGEPGEQRPQFNSGAIRPYNSFEFRFDRPGVYPYHSEVDPSFVGTVVVVERP
jgi:plastocyanin